ncbi:MAG: molybdopterin molybdotransferase MoeA [Nitrospinae bacterium]|nr:molybdopterin molybdotransferase MoeA [Nitrospinota bacterium]
MSAHQTKQLTPLDEALALALEAAEPLEGTEVVSVPSATGRVVAEAVRAEADVPPFDRAAMDGYAVRAADTVGAPVTLTCVERVYAGEETSLSVEPGTCIAVATGAPMPAGADAVVMVEHTEATGEAVRILKPIETGRNAAPRGEDIRAGEVVIESGVLLNPARLGALAAVGRSTVLVYAKPSAVVIPTGKEIVPPGEGPLGPGQIYDINTTTLLASLEEFGAATVAHPVVDDDREALLEVIGRFPEADLLVLTGGSSVGERDLLAEVFSEVGSLIFKGIAVKPGKPTLMARRKGSRQLLVGMPGYPTSCLTNAYLLLDPLVARIGHRSAPRLQTLELPLARAVSGGLSRLQILTVAVAGGKAHPVFKTSGAITSMSEADGYIEIPANSPGLEAGTPVLVKLF